MKTNLFRNICFGLLTLFMVKAHAQESFVRIQLKTLNKPALDLVDEQNRALYLGELKPRFDRTLDLSMINPAENNFWQNTELSQRTALDQMLHIQMPNNGDMVAYDGFVGVVREVGLYAINIRAGANGEQLYRLKAGLQTHASLLKAALLRKIGIYQESPKFYQSIKVKFKSISEMNSFIRQAFCVDGPDEEAIVCLSVNPDERGFLSQRNDADLTLMLHGAYLEKLNPDVPSLFDSLTPSNGNSINLYSQSRAYRSLIIPYVIADAAESINRFSSQSVAVRGGIAYLNFPFASDFNGYTTEDDAKWILRKMAELRDEDWQEIVDAAFYPASVAPLVKAKLLHRYKNMMETFFSRSEFSRLMKVQIPSLNYTSGDGVVIDGKVKTQVIAGYPQRFSHGERQSPFESGDFARYMRIKAQSAVIDTALGRLSDQLKGLSVSNQRVTDIEFHPNGGIKDIASTANVTTYGLVASANRIVTTGTYYGSDAAVQMVDSLTIGANVGHYRVLDGMNNISAIFGGGASLIRNYIHVKPLPNASMRDAARVPVGDMYIPSKLGQLTSPLKDGKLTEFLQALNIGEVFTITDSIGVFGQVGLNHTIDSLIGFGGIGLSIGISADASKMILRQIQFVRTREGLQVYVRNQNNKAFGLEFNVNYLINLLKIRTETTKRDIQTKVYVLNYNSSFVAQVDDAQNPDSPNFGSITIDEDTQNRVDEIKLFGNKAALALRSLLRDSSTEALDEGLKFQRFEVNHDITTKQTMIKFLWIRSTKMNEEHLLSIQKSQIPTLVNGIQVTNEPIQIVTYKKGRLKGKDPFGFGMELVEGLAGELLGENAPRSLVQATQNPSQMPRGQSHWTTVRTDTELTHTRQGALPSVAVIENVWGGWSLKRREMEGIIAKIYDKITGIGTRVSPSIDLVTPTILSTVSGEPRLVNFVDFPLIPTGALSQVDKIDFYRVTAHMSILPDGLIKIKELLLSPAAAANPEEYAKFMDKFVENLTQRYAPQSRTQDQSLFGNLIKMLGNGDEVLGRQAYMRQCERQARPTIGPRGSVSPMRTRLHGTSYECLADWVEELIKLSRRFPVNNLRAQNKWMTEVLYVLDKNVPHGALMSYLGQDKFIFYVEVTGFRSGDEDADQGVYVSNVYGEPAKQHPYANGLISVIADKSKINVTELEQASGGF